MPNCTCLIKATAFKILGRSNLDVKLVIGIISKPKFLSHAWIEFKGRVVFGEIENQSEYQSLLEIK